MRRTLATAAAAGMTALALFAGPGLASAEPDQMGFTLDTYTVDVGDYVDVDEYLSVSVDDLSDLVNGYNADDGYNAEGTFAGLEGVGSFEVGAW